MKNFEIDLKEGMNNPEKAAQVIKQVQDALDEAVIGWQDATAAAKAANDIAEKYQKHCETLQTTSNDLTEALKNVHIVLGSKKDLWKDDKQMIQLMENLGTFVLSSGAIKSGVMNNV